MNIEAVQAHANALGLVVEEDHYCEGYLQPLQEGYWIIDPVTGNGPWPDDNFSTSLEEVARKLVAIEIERKAA